MQEYTQPSQLVKMKTKIITHNFKALESFWDILLPPLVPKGLKSLENINKNPQSVRWAGHWQKEVPPSQNTRISKEDHSLYKNWSQLSIAI